MKTIQITIKEEQLQWFCWHLEDLQESEWDIEWKVVEMKEEVPETK